MSFFILLFSDILGLGLTRVHLTKISGSSEYKCDFCTQVQHLSVLGFKIGRTSFTEGHMIDAFDLII